MYYIIIWPNACRKRVFSSVYTTGVKKTDRREKREKKEENERERKRERESDKENVTRERGKEKKEIFYTRFFFLFCL